MLGKRVEKQRVSMEKLESIKWERPQSLTFEERFPLSSVGYTKGAIEIVCGDATSIPLDCYCSKSQTYLLALAYHCIIGQRTPSNRSYCRKAQQRIDWDWWSNLEGHRRLLWHCPYFARVEQNDRFRFEHGRRAIGCYPFFRVWRRRAE